MMGSLPAAIDPYRLAEKGAHINGVLPVRQMRRVAEICQDESGEVGVELRFERSDVEEVCLLQGTLTATLHVTCQRCLDRMTLHLTARPRLILLRAGGAIEEYNDENDTLVIDKELALCDLIEDEVLLAMPMIPMHELPDCSAGKFVSRSASLRGNEVRQPADNPFSVLRKHNRSD
jgi:uncharacterized protein